MKQPSFGRNGNGGRAAGSLILGATLFVALGWAQTWPGTWQTDTHLDTRPRPAAQAPAPISAPSSPRSQAAIRLVDQCGVAFKAHQYDQAISLCKQAADMGDRGAIEGLAIIYRDGLGQCSQAAPYYNVNKDARPGAASGLGEMYWLGCRDFPRDLRQARSLFESAANRGFINALEDLAWMDELGQGAPHDRPRAIQELKNVARQNNNEWTNDTIIALTQANASRRFNSEEELGGYIADVRFYREIARFNQDEAKRLEAARATAPPGTYLSCDAFGCRYTPDDFVFRMTMWRLRNPQLQPRSAH